MHETWKRMLVGTAVLSASLFAAVAATPNQPPLSVMTRNLYVGSDLMAVATAPDYDSFVAAARTLLTEMASSNFPERAQGLARQVDDRRPDVIALQEVYNLTLDSENGAPPFIDYLAAVQNALADRGLDYLVAASVQDVNVTVPIDLDENGDFEYATLIDRDVILVRADLVDAGAVTPVPLASYCARPSADGGPGCNFSNYAAAALPFGTLILERGFVAVDVVLGGTTYRVVTTHLEVGEDLDPTNPLAPLIQSAQATELKATLDAVSPGVQLIVVGDFNSSPDDPPFPDPVNGPFVRPYQQLSQGVDFAGQPAGTPYLDTWLLRPGSPAGLTCCNPDLTSSGMSASMRIDLVFSRSLPASIKANVFDNNPADKTASGLWPSDHAGLFVRFWF